MQMAGDDGKAALRSFYERTAALLESNGTLDDVGFRNCVLYELNLI